MALTLPLRFGKDIQGKDTSIIPIVTIKGKGGEFADGTSGMAISTNVYHGVDGVIAKPLLLNIPSLRETIDISTRNYKISST